MSFLRDDGPRGIAVLLPGENSKILEMFNSLLQDAAAMAYSQLEGKEGRAQLTQKARSIMLQYLHWYMKGNCKNGLLLYTGKYRGHHIWLLQLLC